MFLQPCTVYTCFVWCCPSCTREPCIQICILHVTQSRFCTFVNKYLHAIWLAVVVNKYFNRIWNSFHYHIRPHSSVLTLLNSSMKCRAFLDFTTLLSRMLSDWLIRYLGSKLKTPFIGPPNILAENIKEAASFPGQWLAPLFG